MPAVGHDPIRIFIVRQICQSVASGYFHSTKYLIQQASSSTCWYRQWHFGPYRDTDPLLWLRFGRHFLSRLGLLFMMLCYRLGTSPSGPNGFLLATVSIVERVTAVDVSWVFASLDYILHSFVERLVIGEFGQMFRCSSAFWIVCWCMSVRIVPFEINHWQCEGTITSAL